MINRCFFPKKFRTACLYIVKKQAISQVGLLGAREYLNIYSKDISSKQVKELFKQNFYAK